MKIFISLSAYVALLEFSNGAIDHEHQHGLNQGLTNIDPFHIPPGSVIVIQRQRLGVDIPGHVVYGTLRPFGADSDTDDENEPYGHVFVIINDDNFFHARLTGGRRYNHDINHRHDTSNEIPEYTCWIRRPSHRSLEATLYSAIQGHDHGLPHVHYMVSDYVHVVGDLTPSPLDDVALRQRQRIDVP